MLDPIRRQLRNSAARGILSLVDDAGGLQRVQMQLQAAPQPDTTVGTETVSNIEVMRQYGLTSVPLPGAEAAYLAVGGVRAHGLVVGIDDRRHRPTGLQAGEVQVYSNLGIRLYLSQEGLVIDGGGLPILFKNTPSVTFDTPALNATSSASGTANVVIGGPVSATGNITSAAQVSDARSTMEEIRQVYDSHGHPAISSPPTQQMPQ